MLGASKPCLREIMSLPMWCDCFLGYVALQNLDPVTRDQLAYARLLIKEAQQHGGTEEHVSSHRASANIGTHAQCAKSQTTWQKIAHVSRSHHHIRQDRSIPSKAASGNDTHLTPVMAITSPPIGIYFLSRGLN